jgi:Fur family ferric uptake transcriptional regulator
MPLLRGPIVKWVEAADRPHARGAWVKHTARLLEGAGHRSSAPRMAVVETLGRQSCVLSAQGIVDALRAEGRPIGAATVYRALDLLEELGAVQRLDVGRSSARYEPAEPSGEHHHHLVCEDCGRVSPFEDEQLERAISRLARRVDHRVAGHDVVLRGSCPECSVDGDAR